MGCFGEAKFRWKPLELASAAGPALCTSGGTFRLKVSEKGAVSVYGMGRFPGLVKSRKIDRRAGAVGSPSGTVGPPSTAS
jgi:hypothetical protein